MSSPTAASSTIRPRPFPTLGHGQTYDDTFTYAVDDSFGSTATATVHITVTGVEDPPVAPDYDISDGVWTVPAKP